MLRPASRIVGSVAVAVLTLVVVSAQYDPVLQYQRRGDRDEGLRTIAVGGLDIELVSARIDGPKPAGPGFSATPAGWGDAVKARFYLPEAFGVYLTVRQLRSQSTYYWLSLPARDQPNLANNWKVKATNEYAWATSTVLAKVRDVRLDDLGAVVRLGQPNPTNIQRVLPVALYDREPVETVSSYRFSFRPLSRVNVTAVIYRDTKPLFRRPGRWEEAGSPFTVLWSPGDAPEGWYRLALSGYFESNAALDREVSFYHRRLLADAIRRGSAP